MKILKVYIINYLIILIVPAIITFLYIVFNNESSYKNFWENYNIFSFMNISDLYFFLFRELIKTSLLIMLIIYIIKFLIVFSYVSFLNNKKYTYILSMVFSLIIWFLWYFFNWILMSI